MTTKRAHAISFFPCREHNPISIGSVNVKAGARIGLPPSVILKSAEDLDKSTLTVGKDKKPIDWDSENGLKLENALILSDEAKKFVIAREVNHVRTSYLYVDLFMQAISLGGGAFLMGVFDKILEKQKRFNMHVAHSPARSILVLLSGAFMFCGYIQANDLYYYWSEYKNDKRTGEMRRDFLEGGVEYYEKVLSRNQVIRELMGERGLEFYTAEGDEVIKWNRYRHMPFTLRRQYLVNYLAEHDAKAAKDDDLQ
jgi:hypothetical protein